ncbi:hypothetical protein J3B02_002400 [Coemansia erecta]|uniref:Uncharacterized protein n=1 Tax=Coemansia asiatica TaxID=1052880 RepID=A0A9W7XGE0_9FUNG|nr:hypothetical protein LPJ64_005481 [Coemansia asiatica]KAJ2854984.1 hypothetical protein J3B02_002400 [Coemansia erecta]
MSSVHNTTASSSNLHEPSQPHDAAELKDVSPSNPPNQGMPGYPAYSGYPAYTYPQDIAPREIQIVAPPTQFRRFGNAAALGLITFGICTVQESMMQAGMSVGYGHGQRTMTGQSIAVAGIAQFAAGLWQIANGDTFEGAAFTSFGAAWIAKGIADVPGLGVLDYQANETPEVVRKQKGIVALAWSIWVLILLAGNVKSHVANIVLFLTLNLQLDFSCAGVWLNHETITKLGGWFGFFCGLSAMYNAATILLNEENFWFNLPVGNWYTPKSLETQPDPMYGDV